MTPQELAHHWDMQEQRRMFRRLLRPERRWVKPVSLIVALLAVGIALEFVTACWLCVSIADGRIW